MAKMARRPFLGTVISGFPCALLGQSINTSKPARIPPVLNGQDRLTEHHRIGVSSTDFKVITPDASGGVFIMEHTNRKKGGPPRHLHHNEDEWFYVIDGEYIVEIGTERFQIKTGDSILAPREVPHVWAFAGDSTGRMLIAFAPANKMEAFFRDSEKRRKGDEYVNDAQFYPTYGLELLGPPLSLEG
jgi:quercetin dioxygenase-like cupin family protein